MKNAVSFAFLALVLSVSAQASVPASKIPLFQKQDVLKMQIQGAMPPAQYSATPATLRVYDGGTWKSYPVTTQVRGMWRTAKSAFDPFFVVFDDKKLPGSLFANAKRKFKVVPHAAGTGVVAWDDDYSQNVFLEYLMYRVVQHIGSPGMLVRLAEMEYLNADGSLYAKSYVFFLENKDDVAVRYGMEIPAEKDKPTYFESRKAEHEVHAYLADHYLTNLDSYLTPDHGAPYMNNMEVLVKDGKLQHTVLYDFDMTHVVKPEYGLWYTRWKLDWTKAEELQWIQDARDAKDAALNPREYSRLSPLADWQKVFDGAAKATIPARKAIFDEIASLPLTKENRRVAESRFTALFDALEEYYP